MWQVLTANLAVVALFISTWEHAHRRLAGQPWLLRNMIFGLFMGAGALATMLLTVSVETDFYFDLRSSLIATSGFFGGPLAVLITACIAAAYRAALGGSGVWSGLWGILMVAAVGVLGHWLVGRRRPKWRAILLLSAACALAGMTGLLLLPPAIMRQTFVDIGPASLGLNFASTLICGFLILAARQRSDERDLLLAALAQAPNYFYIKDLKSRFVAVNRNVAAYNGFASSRAMRGKTDFDLTDPGRAQKLFDAEQQILLSGEALTDDEEQLPDGAGTSRWFETAKIPLHNPDGEIIGLAGQTRDITEDKRLQQELLTSRNLLSHALAEMSDGLALFDGAGRLVFCNDQYRAAFPLTADVRVPGVHLRTILEATLSRGEQLGVPPEQAAAWIEEVVGSLRIGSVQEIELSNGRWLRVRTRPTSDGDATVVTYDITDSRQARQALLSLNDELSRLATVDGLTGLANRRSFDATIAAELARTERDGAPLSLLMADVDRFKRYNDTYGHPAGDECLRLVAQCLRQSARRAGDTAARYGGEEFVAILAGSDEDSAYRTAENFRLALRELKLPHGGSESGIVTVSIGIASYAASDRRRHAAEIIARADEALYDAKAAGRDRTTGWRPRHEVMQA